MCASTHSLRCSKCKAARYCSVACQTQAWPIHKLHCHRLARQCKPIAPSIDFIPSGYIYVTEALRLVDWLRHIPFKRLVVHERANAIGHVFDIHLRPAQLTQWMRYTRMSVAIPLDSLLMEGMSDNRPGSVEILKMSESLEFDHDSLVVFRHVPFSQRAFEGVIDFLHNVDNDGAYGREQWIPTTLEGLVWSPGTHCLYSPSFRRSIRFVFIEFNIVARVLQQRCQGGNFALCTEIMCIIIRFLPQEFVLEFQ